MITYRIKLFKLEQKYFLRRRAKWFILSLINCTITTLDKHHRYEPNYTKCEYIAALIHTNCRLFIYTPLHYTAFTAQARHRAAHPPHLYMAYEWVDYAINTTPHA